ncbi:hypothetical protein SUGI_0769930 [Cryptomeria japonica]|nr:hypothetical protein SUGI_0769930 [Cryptomeria japonica]
MVDKAKNLRLKLSPRLDYLASLRKEISEALKPSKFSGIYNLKILVLTTLLVTMDMDKINRKPVEFVNWNHPYATPILLDGVLLGFERGVMDGDPLQ